MTAGQKCLPGWKLSQKRADCPGSIAIQPMQVCKWRFPAILVLAYVQYAALRIKENHHFRHSLD